MAKAYTSRAPGLKAIRLDVPPDQHAVLEALAFVTGVPMSQYVRQLVASHVEANRHHVASILQARAGAGAAPAATPKAPRKPRAPK
jgi:hypothetical protein